MPTHLINAMFVSGAVIAGLMVTVWLLSVLLRDASIVDIAWGAGFVLVAWAVFFTANDRQRHHWILPVLTTLWGLRLSIWLGWRNHGKPEDHRYQAMRQKWGRSFPIVSLFTVFLLQGIIMWVVSLPLQAGISMPSRYWPTVMGFGVLVWVIGLFFETVGDLQLAQFKADPANQSKVLDSGLWHYTRHPNYFGDFLMWWGLYVVAVSQSSVWWTAVGPAVMSIFLMRVSGVTLLEKSLRQTKPEYEEYERRTNAFFPGPSGSL